MRRQAFVIWICATGWSLSEWPDLCVGHLQCRPGSKSDQVDTSFPTVVELNKRTPKFKATERPNPALKLSAKPVWGIPLLCVQWKTLGDGQRNCPKHVEFYSKKKIWEISASGWFYYKNEVYNIQGVSKRALQLWKRIEIYTEYIHNVLNCQNVAKHRVLPRIVMVQCDFQTFHL